MKNATIEELLTNQGLRFFLFDFILFKPLRKKLEKKSWIFKKLFSCPFCNGFWTSVITRSVVLVKIRLGSRAFRPKKVFTLEQFVDMFILGIVSGFISITWYSIIIPLIEIMEERDAKVSGWINDLPSTIVSVEEQL